MSPVGNLGIVGAFLGYLLYLRIALCWQLLDGMTCESRDMVLRHVHNQNSEDISVWLLVCQQSQQNPKIS